MKAENKRNTIIIILAVSAALVIILLTAGFAAENKNYKPSGWVLKTYNEGVALYKGDEIEAVFGEIDVDSLPDEDVRLLSSGIAFPTKEEAMQAIEDYDG